MDFNVIDNVMEAYNWQLAQMWLEGTVKGIKPGKVYAVNNIVGYGRNETFEMIADYFILNEQKAVLFMCSNCGKKKMENNISERFKTHMYERAFSSDTEDSEKTFEDLCEEAEKMFENQYPNIVFTALDERIVECVSEIDDNKYNVILIEQFRILESKNTEYKGMSKELYKYCAQYLYDIAKQKGYIIIVGININNNEKWLNNWLVKI